MRRWGLLALAAGVVCLAPVGAAPAAVTIGSNLERPVNVEADCGAFSCTRIQTALPGDATAAGGFASPVNGTVTSWRIRAGLYTTPTALRTVAPLDGGQFSGRAISEFVLPPPNSTTSFPAGAPIAAGDLIGLQISGAPVHYFVDGVGSMASFQPVLGDAVPRSPDSTADREIAINADVEPTSEFKVLKRKSKRGGKVVVTVSLPNPGVLRITGVKRAKGHLRARTIQVKPGTLRVRLKPNKNGLASLRDVDRLRTRAAIVFTPTGGIGNSQRVKLTLRA